MVAKIEFVFEALAVCIERFACACVIAVEPTAVAVRVFENELIARVEPVDEVLLVVVVKLVVDIVLIIGFELIVGLALVAKIELVVGI